MIVWRGYQPTRTDAACMALAAAAFVGLLAMGGCTTAQLTTDNAVVMADLAAACKDYQAVAVPILTAASLTPAAPVAASIEGYGASVCGNLATITAVDADTVAWVKTLIADAAVLKAKL